MGSIEEASADETLAHDVTYLYEKRQRQEVMLCENRGIYTLEGTDI